ncbi:hypothetical protein [Rubritalea sp.]
MRGNNGMQLSGTYYLTAGWDGYPVERHILVGDCITWRFTYEAWCQV